MVTSGKDRINRLMLLYMPLKRHEVKEKTSKQI